jgi:threonine/homoserine/homoserine lactone efflux protein
VLVVAGTAIALAKAHAIEHAAFQLLLAALSAATAAFILVATAYVLIWLARRAWRARAREPEHAPVPASQAYGQVVPGMTRPAIESTRREERQAWQPRGSTRQR